MIGVKYENGNLSRVFFHPGEKRVYFVKFIIFEGKTIRIPVIGSNDPVIFNGCTYSITTVENLIHFETANGEIILRKGIRDKSFFSVRKDDHIIYERFLGEDEI